MALNTVDSGSAGSARPWLKHYDPAVPAHLTYPRIPIHRLLEDSAAKVPNQDIALFYGRHFNYRSVNEAAGRFAAGMRALGVKVGDRVGLLLPNSPQYLVAYYGLLKAGIIVVPLNPLSTERELIYHISDSGTETIITLPMFLEKVLTLRKQTPLKRVIYSRLADYLPPPLSLIQGLRETSMLRKARKLDGAVLTSWREVLRADPIATSENSNPESMAVLIYSGGTTGVAKGIMLSHYQCVANAHQIVAWGQMTGEGRILAVLPLFHGFGMSVTMNAPVLAGGAIVLIPRFSAKAVLSAIQKERPDFFIGVPTMFAAFNNLPDVGNYDLSSLKGIFVGAAPLTKAIKDGFEARTGGRMIEGYGLTESVTAIMANPYKGQHKVGSIGIPFSDVDMKIVSLEDGKPRRDLPPGELGEIILRSPTLMLGYYKNEEDTRNTIIDGWLYTGDIGYMDEDGYFYITDRKKDLIIVGGFNVFPREIDELLYQHPKIKEGICVGVPDTYKGERIKVFVVLKDGETATAEEIIMYFRGRLTPYKVPSEVEFRQELPKSMIGKILRRALREETIAAEARKVQPQ